MVVRDYDDDYYDDYDDELGMLDGKGDTLLFLLL